MPDLLLELFSEEIPARMQPQAADDLKRLITDALAERGLFGAGAAAFVTPRRLVLHIADLPAAQPDTKEERKGPKVGAPEAAIAGFLKSAGLLSLDQAKVHEDARKGSFYVAIIERQGRPTIEVLAEILPAIVENFPWPKSMRWGGTSGFTWVRPLRRILCLLDGEVVPFSLATGDDDGHGLVADNLTEGHRFMAPGAVAVSSVEDWQAKLRERFVLTDEVERAASVAAGIAGRAAGAGVRVVEDAGLISEVAGLVEWPVALLGRIDDAFMDLPPEVRQVSMRVNQRYFATVDAAGAAAPYFAFVANNAAPDGGAAIVAGNERVLRARFADARHFWDLDRKTPLCERVPALDGVTFQAALGSQGARVRRLVRLAEYLAPLVGADAAETSRAALLAKADLTTGMVGEFPELQGVMGGYYARHDGEADAVADAVRDHYGPKGPGDAVPAAPVSIAVALADKIDTLAAFFAIGERPTGSGDPFALRRAALGVIRILRERGLRIPLRAAFGAAEQSLAGIGALPPGRLADDVLDFMAERLRVQLRGEGARHDVLAAVFAAGHDDDFVRALARTQAVAALLGSDDGANLLAAYKRAANILRIEERKDGPHDGAVDAALLQQDEERALSAALAEAASAERCIAEERFSDAASVLAGLRAPLDAFFVAVMVNHTDPAIRANRLRLLAGIRAAINRVADFSAIES